MSIPLLALARARPRSPLTTIRLTPAGIIQSQFPPHRNHPPNRNFQTHPPHLASRVRREPLKSFQYTLKSETPQPPPPPPPPSPEDPAAYGPLDRNTLISHWTLQLSPYMPKTFSPVAATEFVDLLLKLVDIEAAERDGVWWGPCVIVEIPGLGQDGGCDRVGIVGARSVEEAAELMAGTRLGNVFRVLDRTGKIWIIPREDGMLPEFLRKQVEAAKGEREVGRGAEVRSLMAQGFPKDLAEEVAEESLALGHGLDVVRDEAVKKGVWWGPVAFLEGPTPKGGERPKLFTAMGSDRWAKVQEMHLRIVGKKALPDQKKWDVPKAKLPSARGGSSYS